MIAAQAHIGTVQAAGTTLLSAGDFVYQGAFRVPYSSSMKVFSYSGIAPCLTNIGTLILTGWTTTATNSFVQCEMSLPAPAIGPQSSLPVATLLNGPTDLSNGIRTNDLHGGTGGSQRYFGGMIRVGDELLTSMYVYYDVAPASQARYSHFFCGMNFAAPSSRGPYALSPDTQSGFAAGCMCQVPTEYQSTLGSPYFTGLSGAPAVYRESQGPNSIGFDPATLSETPAPCTYLLNYPDAHPYGEYQFYKNQSPNWNLTSRSAGTFFLNRNGKAAIGHVGWSGNGKCWYGMPTEDFTDWSPYPGSSPTPADCTAHPEYIPFVRSLGVCSEPLKPDGLPIFGAKGTHSSSYACVCWLYDPADYLAVKQGLKQPWELQPYEIVQLPLQYQNWSPIIGGAAYDEETGKLYISHQMCDRSRSSFDPCPVIEEFQLAP